MVIQPTIVPDRLFWAIYRVVHNQATVEDWEHFDTYSVAEVLQHVKTLLEANSPKLGDVEKELTWFTKELAKGRN